MRHTASDGGKLVRQWYLCLIRVAPFPGGVPRIPVLAGPGGGGPSDSTRHAAWGCLSGFPSICLQVLSQICPNSNFLLFMGLFFTGAGFVTYSLAPTALWAYVASFIQACGSIWQPGLMAIIASTVRADEVCRFHTAQSEVLEAASAHP